MGNVIWSSLDIFKKVSSGLQIIERAGGLLLPGRLAVERSVVVIRNPFQPVVRSITRQARKNETVTIQGRNFPFFSDPVVSFCTFSEADAVEEGEPLKNLVAEIMSKNDKTIIVKVPENFGEIFNSSEKVVVCIAVGAKRGDSRRLGSAGVFQYIPPPSLSSISPSATVASGVIFLRGDHFDTRDPSETKVVLNGGRELQTSRVGRDFISIVLPTDIEVGSYQATVTYRGDTTQELGFTVQEPPTNVGDLTKGLWIVVTKADMMDTPDDGEISFGEALLMVSGKLTRELERHKPCELLPFDHPERCEWEIREIDYVLPFEEGALGGALARDTIVLSEKLENNIINVGTTLTSPGTGDTIFTSKVLQNNKLSY